MLSSATNESGSTMTWALTRLGWRRRLAVVAGCATVGVLSTAGPAGAYEFHLLPFTFSNLSHHKLTLTMVPITGLDHARYQGVEAGSEVPARSEQAFKHPPTPNGNDVIVTFQYRVDGVPDTYVDYIVAPYRERGSAQDAFESCTFDRHRRTSPDTFPYDHLPVFDGGAEDGETTAGPDHMACGWDLANQPFFLQPKHVRLPR
jgi:hypothetical protein